MQQAVSCVHGNNIKRVRTKSINEMILKLTTVLYGPVLEFTAVQAWRTGRQFLPKQMGKKKATRPSEYKSQPKYPKSSYFCTNSVITQEKYLTGHECITMVPNSDHFTTHVVIVQTKTATVHSEEKQNGIYLYSSPKISITPTIKISNKQGTLFPN